jgi:hypothetical protein
MFIPRRLIFEIKRMKLSDVASIPYSFGESVLLATNQNRKDIMVKLNQLKNKYVVFEINFLPIIKSLPFI